MALSPLLEVPRDHAADAFTEDEERWFRQGERVAVRPPHPGTNLRVEATLTPLGDPIADAWFR